MQEWWHSYRFYTEHPSMNADEEKTLAVIIPHVLALSFMTNTLLTVVVRYAAGPRKNLSFPQTVCGYGSEGPAYYWLALSFTVFALGRYKYVEGRPEVFAAAELISIILLAWVPYTTPQAKKKIKEILSTMKDLKCDTATVLVRNKFGDACEGFNKGLDHVRATSKRNVDYVMHKIERARDLSRQGINVAVNRAKEKLNDTVDATLEKIDETIDNVVTITKQIQEKGVEEVLTRTTSAIIHETSATVAFVCLLYSALVYETYTLSTVEILSSLAVLILLILTAFLGGYVCNYNTHSKCTALAEWLLFGTWSMCILSDILRKHSRIVSSAT